jgi:hypothetical protein
MLQRVTDDVRISPSFLLDLLFARYRYTVRAKPLAKPVRHGSVTPELEVELIRRYHEDGDLDALERLVEAHRPMVVSAAKNMWRGTGTPLKVLVAYGMLGLRLAAAPPRPSKTKKGAMVGFGCQQGPSLQHLCPSLCQEGDDGGDRRLCLTGVEAGVRA